MITSINNDEDHHKALIEAKRLWSYPDNSPENNELDALATIIEQYEMKRWPMPALNESNNDE